MSLRRSAVIIGASSGIGAALARRLSEEGWRLGLVARRVELLEKLASELPDGSVVRQVDIAKPEEAVAILERLFTEMGGVDLVVISSGTGQINRDLRWDLDRQTLDVNVLGFAAVAQAVMRYFLERGQGHLVGITSVAALRGNGGGASYAASKAFQSNYLDGLRDLVAERRLPIVVTEVQPGFVDTPMMDAKLSAVMRRLLVASPDKAARQIATAIRERTKHAYITRRYAPIAFIVKLLPRPG